MAGRQPSSPFSYLPPFPFPFTLSFSHLPLSPLPFLFLFFDKITWSLPLPLGFQPPERWRRDPQLPCGLSMALFQELVSFYLVGSFLDVIFVCFGRKTMRGWAPLTFSLEGLCMVMSIELLWISVFRMLMSSQRLRIYNSRWHQRALRCQWRSSLVDL